MANCKTCGEDSVIEDYNNGRTVLVCTECGALDNESHEFEAKECFEGTSLTDGLGRGPSGLRAGSQFGQTIKAGIVFGKTNIQFIGRKLHFSEAMISEGISMYNRVFEKLLRNAGSISRKAMCGACLYCVARQHGDGIGIKQVGQVLDITSSGKKLTLALKSLQKHFGIYAPPVTIKSETEYFLSQNDFSPEVKTLTHDIVSLCERYWISQGRISSITIKVAAYFAWRACDLSNHKKELSAFCKEFGIENQKACSKRKVELEKLVHTSVQEIPWLKGQTISCIDPYIKDVVQYQKTLMPATLQTGATQIKNKDLQNENKAWIDEAKEFGTIFREKGKHKPKHVDTYVDDVTKKRKKFKTAEELDNDSDIDLIDLGSDDDTDQYIRTASEVNNIRTIKEKMWDSKDE